MARGGDRTAFGVLYERHHRAARRLAHTLFPNAAGADDAVAEAFARVRSALRQGGGPSEAFRVSLVAALRAVADERSPLTVAIPGEADSSEAVSTTGKTPDETYRTGFQVELVRRAFARLPERSQAVLWHSEIDDTSARELTAILGKPEDELGTLADQARRELRQAQLLLYAASTSVGECRDCAEHLGAYTQHDLRWRRRRRVREHLEGCHRCALVYAALVAVGAALTAAMLPGIDESRSPSRSRQVGAGAGIGARAPHPAPGSGARTRATAGVAALVVALIAALVVVARSDDDVDQRRDVGSAVGTTSTISTSPATVGPSTGSASTTTASTSSATAGTAAATATSGDGTTRASVATTSSPGGPGGPDASLTSRVTSVTTRVTVRPVPITTRPAPPSPTTRGPEPPTTVGPGPAPGTTVAPSPSTVAPRPTPIPPVAPTTPTTVPAPGLSGDVQVASQLFAGRPGVLSATLENPGPGVVEGLEITVQVPAVFTIVGATLADGGGPCSTTTAVATCSVPVVGPSSAVTVRLDIAVSPAAGRSVEIVMSWSTTEDGARGPVASTLISVTIVPTCGSGKVPPGPPESCQP